MAVRSAVTDFLLLGDSELCAIIIYNQSRTIRQYIQCLNERRNLLYAYFFSRRKLSTENMINFVKKIELILNHL